MKKPFLLMLLASLCLFSISCKKSEAPRVYKTLTIDVSTENTGVSYNLTANESTASGPSATNIIDIQASKDNKTYTLQYYTDQTLAFNWQFKGGKGTVVFKANGSQLYANSGVGGSFVRVMP